MSRLTASLIFGVILYGGALSCGQTIIYVDDDAPLGGDGTTWNTAFKYLQDALSVASDGDEIRVAQGTYRPDRDEDGNVTPGDREATFQLVTGVGLYGGYRGCPGGDCGGGDPNEREVHLHETILDGDLFADDTPVPCVQDSPDCDSYGMRCIDGACVAKQNNNENSYHVVTGSGTDATAVLDGVTITAGNSRYRQGSGMRNESGSSTVRNCTFYANYSSGHGAGMYNTASSPTLTDCTFVDNHSGYNVGGAMYNLDGSNITLTRCKFIGNSANRGGGIDSSDSTLTLTDCLFRENWTTWSWDGAMSNHDSTLGLTNCIFIGNNGRYGGAMGNIGGTLTLTNCLFGGNVATEYDGGAICNWDSVLTLTNCTISGNSAVYYGGGLANRGNTNVLATNCIFWGNSDRTGLSESAQVYSGDVIVGHSCIQGCAVFCSDPSSANTGTDPRFVDADGIDDIYGTEDDDLHLEPGSPCVDAGDNSVVTVEEDLDGNPRIVGGAVDMGVYEFIVDCNGNGIPDELETDTDGDGIIDDCEDDDDNDGVPDAADTDPLDPDACIDVDRDGCDDCAIGSDDFGPLPDNDPANDGPDNDGDGTCNEGDRCPEDPNKIFPGICGCGTPDVGDEDQDGVLDCLDQCPGVDDATFAPECQGAIPTVSAWGLVVLALLILVCGKLYFGRRMTSRSTS